MQLSSRRIAMALAVSAVSIGATSAPAGADPITLSSVPAQTKTAGVSLPDVLSPQLRSRIVAQGSDALENPSACVGFYGYDAQAVGTAPTPANCAAQSPFTPIAPSTPEANKTEPDKNTYLKLDDQTGADPRYDYGEHFLFQGHETGAPGYITRVNLDADAAHRISLLATTDVDGKNLPNFDGSTWNPFAKRLLFTSESNSTGGVWQATATVPSTVVNLQGILGVGGYEGIQNDSAGNLWIVEDTGGTKGAVNTFARTPNSFIYRFKPTDRRDLTAGGKLQVLQVESLKTPGSPVVFHGPATGNPTAAQADADILSADTKDIHTYGHTMNTRWVTVHDTAVDGVAAFSANAASKAAGGTPFKRPENGVFAPGSGFRSFYFTETGDTDNRTQAAGDFGGYGGLQRLDQSSPSADTGTLRLFYKSDQAHTGLDNIQFLTRRTLVSVEDAGDTLHTQRTAFDSAYAFNIGSDYASGADPVRFLAQGRDPSATIDSAGGPLVAGNDGDNEITGFHVSNGDPSREGILGATAPEPFDGGDWRVFYTGQHGDNVTREILGARG